MKGKEIFVMELSVERKKRAKKIPNSFLYEIMDGRPLYYKGYKKAIAEHQDVESIKGINSLQAEIISHLVRILFKIVSENDYWVFPGRPGISLNQANHLVSSILVLDKNIFPASKISKNYIDTPADLHIEVDIYPELEDMTEMGYVKKKTQKLLDFGTQRVLWIFTSSQQVLIATPGEDWKWVDWNKNIELWQETNCNIGSYLQSEGFDIEKIYSFNPRNQ